MNSFVENVVIFLIGCLGAAAILVFEAVAQGVLLYLIWPVAINGIFPTLLDGAIAGALTLKEAIFTCLVFQLLIKSVSTNKGEKK